ncbi:MAG: hypothetical protein ACYDG6_09395 [Thermincolia bacterium]
MAEEKKIKKHTDFIPEDIKKHLDVFRKLILSGKYTISKNNNRKRILISLRITE